MAKNAPPKTRVKNSTKNESVSSLKKKAWDLFSKYIRLKGSDWRGYGKCVTCDEVKEWKRLQAGHFIPGRRNSILFDERNVHIQCDGCNRWKQGNTVKYFRFMQKTYGDSVIEELEHLNTIDKQFTPIELKGMIEDLKIKIKKYE
jgi:hypothetical protein